VLRIISKRDRLRKVELQQQQPQQR
jgi:hypothetical protein